MARRTADELNGIIDGLSISDEEKISIMEDITDSIVEDTSDALEEIKAKYQDLQARYKARFMEAKSDPDPEEDEIEEKDDKIIDIKNI